MTAKGVAAGSVMVIKTDVQGGMPPSKECEVGVDTLIEVPMNNTYTFYACANTREALALRWQCACAGQPVPACLPLPYLLSPEPNHRLASAAGD